MQGEAGVDGMSPKRAQRRRQVAPAPAAAHVRSDLPGEAHGGKGATETWRCVGHVQGHNGPLRSHPPFNPPSCLPIDCASPDWVIPPSLAQLPANKPAVQVRTWFVTSTGIRKASARYLRREACRREDGGSIRTDWLVVD